MAVRLRTSKWSSASGRSTRLSCRCARRRYIPTDGRGATRAGTSTPRIASAEGSCHDVLDSNEVSWSCTGDSWRSGGPSPKHPEEGAITAQAAVPASAQPGGAEAGLRHHRPVVRNQLEQLKGPPRIDLEARQIAVVDADDLRPHDHRRLELTDVVDFDESFEEILSRANDMPRHADRLRSHLN